MSRVVIRKMLKFQKLNCPFDIPLHVLFLCCAIFDTLFSRQQRRCNCTVNFVHNLTLEGSFLVRLWKIVFFWKSRFKSWTLEPDLWHHKHSESLFSLVMAWAHNFPLKPDPVIYSLTLTHSPVPFCLTTKWGSDSPGNTTIGTEDTVSCGAAKCPDSHVAPAVAIRVGHRQRSAAPGCPGDGWAWRSSSHTAMLTAAATAIIRVAHGQHWESPIMPAPATVWKFFQNSTRTLFYILLSWMDAEMCLSPGRTGLFTGELWHMWPLLSFQNSPR